MNENKIHHGSFLTNNLPDKSQQLIIADPPYYKVKGEFDFIWKTFDDYLKDVEKWAVECKRLLADNGSLLWYGDRKKIAYSQIMLDKYFNLESNITIKITDRQTNKIKPEDSRCFINCSERVLFYSNETQRTGLEEINANPELYKSIKVFFDKWLELSGLSLKEAVLKIGSSCTHWFGFSLRNKTQFSFPTKDKWDAMEKVFPLRNEYEKLRNEYEKLRNEYEKLRRPFLSVEKYKLDVLEFSQESHKTRLYDHDTSKPEKLTETLILTTSRKGDNIFVPFSGSGTECAMAAKTGRNFEGWDIEKKYAEMGRERVKPHLEQLKLF